MFSGCNHRVLDTLLTLSSSAFDTIHSTSLSTLCLPCSLTDTLYQASKFRKGVWVPCTLRVTSTALERLDPTTKEVAWRLRYVDLRSPGAHTLVSAVCFVYLTLAAATLARQHCMPSFRSVLATGLLSMSTARSSAQEHALFAQNFAHARDALDITIKEFNCVLSFIYVFPKKCRYCDAGRRAAATARHGAQSVRRRRPRPAHVRDPRTRRPRAAADRRGAVRAGAVHHCAGALWRQLRRKLWQSCVNCHKNQHSCVLTRRRGPALAAAHRLS